MSQSVASLQSAPDELAAEGRGTPSPRPEHVQCTSVTRPLVVCRERAATLFDEIMTARAEARDTSVSNRAVGDRLGISEKQVRQWRAGDKPIPLGAPYEMPESLSSQLLRTMLRQVESRGMVSARSADSHGRRLGAQLGVFLADLESALADGVLTEEERRRLMLDLLNVDRRCAEAMRDLVSLAKGTI